MKMQSQWEVGDLKKKVETLFWYRHRRRFDDFPECFRRPL